MIRKLLALLVAVTTLGLVGCFNYEEVLTLEKDGSGTMVMKLGIQQSLLESFEAMSTAFAETDEPVEPEPFISKKQIESYLAEHDVGVKLLSYAETEEEGMKVWNMKYSFKDLNNFHHVSQSFNSDFDTMEGEDEADESEEDLNVPELSFTMQDDGTWLFERGMESNDAMSGMGGMGMEDDDDYDDTDEPGDVDDDDDDMKGAADDDDSSASDSADMDMEDMGAMLESMSNLGVKLTVHFPGKVIESNATSFEGNTAVWDLSLNEMAAFPSKLTAVIK